MKKRYLVEKDLRVHALSLAVVLLIQVSGVGLFWMQLPHIPGIIWLLMNGTMLVGDFLLAYRVTVYEEKHKAYLFLQTLPVTVGEIVTAKFIAVAIFVSANFALLGLAYSFGISRGWIMGRQPGWWSLVVALLLHLLVAALFVALALLFQSDRAVWIPFPALFLVMSAVLNYTHLIALVHGEALIHQLASNQVLLILLLAALVSFVAWFTTFAVGRKRMLV